MIRFCIVERQGKKEVERSLDTVKKLYNEVFCHAKRFFIISNITSKSPYLPEIRMHHTQSLYDNALSTEEGTPSQPNISIPS